MLALVWAIQKIRLYLAGSKFKVVTSHQPLVAICNGKNLDAINNMWIQRLLAETMGYEFRVLWTDGKYNWIADALSRSPVFAAEPNDTELVCTVKTTQIFKTSQETNSSYDPALQKIIDIAEEDADYQKCNKDIKKSLLTYQETIKDKNCLACGVPCQSKMTCLAYCCTMVAFLYHKKL